VADGNERSAEIAFEALRELARDDEQLRAVLAQLSDSPNDGRLALRTWLDQQAAGGLPPVIATYLSGGRTERLVNVARADTVVVSSGSNAAVDRAGPAYGLVLRRTIQTANRDGSVTTVVVEFFSEELALQSLREESPDEPRRGA